jgi:Domain of unknown function (DUF4340)
VNNEWQLSGQPSLKVKPEVIRQTLDALAGLRAERYLEDRAADLKLYGLEPPQLVLQIQTTSGSRVLHLGRHEGESDRYYATVPASAAGLAGGQPGKADGATAVFVIGETDATRIVRRKEAYIKK